MLIVGKVNTECDDCTEMMNTDQFIFWAEYNSTKVEAAYNRAKVKQLTGKIMSNVMLYINVWIG